MRETILRQKIMHHASYIAKEHHILEGGDTSDQLKTREKKYAILS